MKTLPLIIFVLAHSACNESAKTVDLKTISITGTILASPDVTPPEGILAGESIKGAKVFIKGYPSQVAETDENGAFTLLVTQDDVDPTSDPATLKRDYEVFMMYTVERPFMGFAIARLGASRDIDTSAEQPIDLGTVNLHYTTALNIEIYDAVQQDQLIRSCDLEVDGFDYQILTGQLGGGYYEVDYMPESQYQLNISCEGYTPKNIPIDVKVGESIDDRAKFTFYMDPL